ncbi:acyl-CoA dehydrogenase family protein [Frankia sp. AiPa1]|uniref:acyl-CoA dehydrogenase family protein n=1 Tax=Frankia sp. AiPa1 TaxID=573492 RepID=UPI00202AF5D2|nr:acyl-CoA dehydrogenase family protein [Frankia sp. AiPa1]MCL9759250.1 hypothetical protein [Frankia sp. AiPa1]
MADHAAILAAGTDDSERDRRLTETSVRALRTSGLFGVLAPREVGGDQVDPLTELELIEAVSAIDPSTGWSFWATAGSTGRAASMIPDEALGEVFPAGRPLPLFAFQERPFGNVHRPARDGLLVSGRWPFGTGVAHADWVVAIGTVREPASAFPGAGVLAAAVPMAQVRVVDESWDAAGLAGTGTFDYAVEEVLVPWHRVWAYPPNAPMRGAPHFSFRRAAIKHTGFALGVARTVLDRFIEHTAALRATDGVAGAVAESELRLQAARALGWTTVAAVWDEARTTGQVAAGSQARLRAVARYVTEIALEVCGLLHRHGDASLLARQHPLQRALRDMTVAAAHGEVSARAIVDHGAHLIAAHRHPTQATGAA